MYNVKDLGKRIAAYRKNLGITQEELAARLNITAQAVSKWENELSFPDITALPELAKALNTSMEKLFGNEANQNNGVNQCDVPGFPEFISETLKLAHTFKNIGCYSEKEVEITSDDSVIFKDGSSANLRTQRIVNKGAGEICFDFRDDILPTGIDMSRTELSESFDNIASLKISISIADVELVGSEDKKSRVTAIGSPIFIGKLKVFKDGEQLCVLCDDVNNNSEGKGSRNKITITFGGKAGSNIDAHINGSGKCELKVPFQTGDISLNGSGEIIFDTISNVKCKINGSGDIKCNKAGNPLIHINGSGDFTSREVSGTLKSHINGSGDIYTGSGELDFLEARICGSGDIHAGDVSAKTANIAVEGSGDVTIGRVIVESVEKHSKNSSIKILKRG